MNGMDYKELGMSKEEMEKSEDVKTFTLEDVEMLVGKAMNITSPLGQKVMATFKDTPPDVEAKEILYKMNHARFCNSGYVSGLKGEVAKQLESQLCEQIDKQFQVEELNHREMTIDSDSFTAGYMVGMGATSLERIS
jgi:hypothetical protein